MAELQHDLFIPKQAKAAGYSVQSQHHNAKVGNWIREYRGIYKLVRYPKSEWANLSSLISAWQISWAVPSTLAHVDFEGGSTSGWTCPSALAYLPGQDQFGWQLYPNRPGAGRCRGAEIDRRISIRTRHLFLAAGSRGPIWTQRFPHASCLNS